MGDADEPQAGSPSANMFMVTLPVFLGLNGVAQWGCSTHLRLWGASFISDQQQVTLTINHDLLLKASACGRQQPLSEVQEPCGMVSAALYVLVWHDWCHRSDQWMDRSGEWWLLFRKGVNVYDEHYRCEWSAEEVAKGDVTHTHQQITGAVLHYWWCWCMLLQQSRFFSLRFISGRSLECRKFTCSLVGCGLLRRCFRGTPSVLNSGVMFYFKLLSSAILLWRLALTMFKPAILAERF